MKSAQSAEVTQKPMPGTTKRQIASRLKKSTTYAENLVRILQETATTHATPTDLLEAKAYLALMKGALCFERGRWQACLHEYSQARLIYATLGLSARSDVYRDLLSGTIDPSIRYAAYQLKVPRTKPVPQIAIEQFLESEGESRKELEKINKNAFDVDVESKVTSGIGTADLPSTISWRGRTVKLEDAAIAQALGLAMTGETDLSSRYKSYLDSGTGLEELSAAYDDVINARQEAVDATKAAISELLSEGVDQSDSRMQSLQITRTAVNYAVIEWRVGRNRLLCGESDGMNFEPAPSKRRPKPQIDGQTRPVKEEGTGRKIARLRERVALYDNILQSIDAVKELPGVIADTAFVNELTGKRSYFQALRCLAIGRSHAVSDSSKNGLALFARALDLAESSKASSDDSTTEVLKLDLTLSTLNTFTQYIQGLVSQYRGLVELQNITAAQSTDKSRWKPPLIERLHEYDDDVDLKNLVTYPPKLRPIPVKPLFFDLAWNYIDYPGRTPAAAAAAVNGVSTEAEPATEEPRRTRRGWFGFGGR